MSPLTNPNPCHRVSSLKDGTANCQRGSSSSPAPLALSSQRPGPRNFKWTVRDTDRIAKLAHLGFTIKQIADDCRYGGKETTSGEIAALCAEMNVQVRVKEPS